MSDGRTQIPLHADPFREAIARDPVREPRTDRECVESIKHLLKVELPARRAHARRSTR